MRLAIGSLAGTAGHWLPAAPKDQPHQPSALAGPGADHPAWTQRAVADYPEKRQLGALIPAPMPAEAGGDEDWADAVLGGGAGSGTDRWVMTDPLGAEGKRRFVRVKLCGCACVRARA